MEDRTGKELHDQYRAERKKQERDFMASLNQEQKKFIEDLRSGGYYGSGVQMTSEYSK